MNNQVEAPQTKTLPENISVTYFDEGYINDPYKRDLIDNTHIKYYVNIHNALRDIRRKGFSTWDTRLVMFNGYEGIILRDAEMLEHLN